MFVFERFFKMSLFNHSLIELLKVSESGHLCSNFVVTECEKKWRYLRDKYVKERRRLIDETKATGREAKSNWQHYESMEFLATHLRLPVNGSAERSSSIQLEEEESRQFSEGSPNASMLSPPTLTDIANIKNELENRTQSLANWPTPPEIEKVRSQEQGDPFKPLAPPPHYPGFINRPSAPAAAAAFTHHPLWAMWSNSIAQAQAQAQHQQQHLNNLNSQQKPPISGSASNPASPPVSDIAVCNDVESEPPKPKKAKKSSQDVNINVSIKDFAVPAEKYSEYHFCMSLAQMMDSVPANQRPDLKIKLIQMVTSNYPQKEGHSEGSPLSL